MDITQENTDQLNSVVKLKLGPKDYEEKVNKILKDYKRKANMPGFRPGMVPYGMIKKMYGKAVMVDEINKLLSESLGKYIDENKLDNNLPHFDGNNFRSSEITTQLKLQFSGILKGGGFAT